MDRTRVLISGGGIAGLTCAIELKRNGFTPIVIEKEPGPRTEGYMMDFFGTGWDVAERMGLTEALRKIRYPIDWLAFVDTTASPSNSRTVHAIMPQSSSAPTACIRACAS